MFAIVFHFVTVDIIVVRDGVIVIRVVIGDATCCGIDCVICSIDAAVVVVSVIVVAVSCIHMFFLCC